MSPQEKKKRCKNHKPRYDEKKGGSVIYHCPNCGWRGQFGNGEKN